MDKVGRRQFIGAAAAATAFTIVPRHVLGGQGFVAPSDKITVGYIGCGTEGLLELMTMLTIPEVQVVAACDPVKDSNAYLDFGMSGAPSNRVKGGICGFLGKPDWRQNQTGIPGGCEVGKEVIESYYAQFRPNEKFSGVATYADFRELLAKQKDLDALKIMTPDHLHATIAIAAMKMGKHVVVHKPIANRLNEARLVFETARQTKVATFYMPVGQQNRNMDMIAGWINGGAMGTLREIHNWTDRPVWPQFQNLPTDRPRIPKGFDWDLWLGPSLDRPYHPNYTHLVFRGWYEFGGGAMADMGYYSLCPVFATLNLPAAISATPAASRAFCVDGNAATRIMNDYSFPLACSIRFKLPAANGRPPIDLYWYDGGMRPPTPSELDEDGRELGSSGLLFVGDKGKILDGRIIPESKMKAYPGQQPPPLEQGRGGRGAAAAGRDQGQGAGGRAALPPGQASGQGGPSMLGDWLKACKGGEPSSGDFLKHVAVTETLNLGAVALRAGGRIVYDPATGKITNNEAANKFLTREYRKGWELS